MRFSGYFATMAPLKEGPLGKPGRAPRLHTRHPNSNWEQEVEGGDFKVDGQVTRKKINGEDVYTINGNERDAANVICTKEFKKKNDLKSRCDVGPNPCLLFVPLTANTAPRTE